MYHPFLVGNRIYLRGFEFEDLSREFFQWANDEEVTRFLFMGERPNIKENLEEWFQEMRKNQNEVVMIVADIKNNKSIGFCGLHAIRWVSRNAEYRIFIGDKSYWNKGIGQEPAQLLIRYGFEKLNMNKIWLGVNFEHKRAVKSYETSGFKKEGILREELYRNSKYYDVVRMSILRSEYYSDLKPIWDKEIPNPSESK